MREAKEAGEWFRVLELQARTALPFELASYYRTDRWMAAREVIDVGTGAGAYLQQLASVFPDKRYRGIDIDGQAIAHAIKRNKLPNVTYLEADASSYGGSPAEALILRAVLQHVPEHDRLVNSLARLLKPGGILIVIQGQFDSIRMVPPAPTISEMFRRLDYLRAHTMFGGLSPLRSFEEKAKRCGLTVLRKDVVSVLSTIAGNRKLLIDQFDRVIPLVSQRAGISSEEGAAMSVEWSEWKAANSFVELAADVEVLAKAEGRLAVPRLA